jgi:hypothetical protein
MGIHASEFRVRAPDSPPDDELLSRYMSALLRRCWVDDDDLRTCTHCGSHVEFEPDGETAWSICSGCGALA